MATTGLNLANAFAALADADPDRECLVFRNRSFSRADVRERAGRVAGLLAAAGLGCLVERDELPGWERGQSTVGLFLYNGNEYLESMLGAYAARCAPVNLNWRASAEELAYLIDDAGLDALVHHRSLAPVVTAALATARRPVVLLEVDDDGNGGPPAVEGAVGYEEALAAAPTTWLPGSPDDLYVLYTGGTTGRPKGTLWRQCDFVAGALGINHRTNDDVLAAAARSGGRLRTLPTPPFIHGAAQWNAWSAWLSGGTVILQSVVRHFDPIDVLDTIARHRVTSVQIVGDAFGRPLLDAMASHRVDLSSLRFLTSGGTVLSPDVRDGLRAALPDVTILDILGSSESGRLAVATHGPGRTGGFVPAGAALVVDEHRRALVPPDDDHVGWLATTGPIPLGYLGDEARTHATFPVIDGVRYTVPGDRARWRADGTVEVLGRDSSVINTGGEKVFAEEVEDALKTHPAVTDALVVGRPHPTLGHEVCAVVAVRPTEVIGAEELRAHVAQHLARYKLPRRVVVRADVQRSPAGKPDYVWARAQLDAALT
jgi:fatty-acyl-CoA synthase